MQKRYFIIHILQLLLFSSAVAQNEKVTLKFDLSVRYRFESWQGMNAKNYGDDSPDAIGNLNDKILYQRIIPGFTLGLYKKITFGVHLQDSRAFGWSLRNSEYPDLFKVKKKGTAEPYYTMNPNEEFFEIYDAFVEYRKILPNLTAKLGRQKIFYGDNHIFGPGEWGNTGRWTWDALKVSYKKGRNVLDAFAGGTKIHDPERISLPFSKTEYWGGGFYGHLPIKRILDAEPFYALKVRGSADYIHQQKIIKNWLGLRLVNQDSFSFIFDFTLTGEWGKENDKKINAFGFFAKLGYQFNVFWAKPILSIRESYASGGKISDDKITTFDPAFGASDKYYGWMNITQWTNLDDREIVLELFPVKKMWIELKYNWFFIPVPNDAVLLNTMKLQEGKHHLGNEFDTFVRYQAFKHWQFTGAFGYFWAKDLQQINDQPAKDAYWFALQTLFTI